MLQSSIMAKKKTRRQHQFKHVKSNSLTNSPARSAEVVRPAAATTSPASAPTTIVTSHPFAYVLSDLRKVAVMGAGFVALQLILWYIFNATALGERIYSLVRL